MNLSCTKGLTDKLYWRPNPITAKGSWHCYERIKHVPVADRQGYTSGFMALCGRAWIPLSGGQENARPPSLLRCGLCDGREATRRGWEEGGANSENWELWLH